MGRGGSRKGAGRKPGPAEAKRRNRLQINLTDAEYDGIRALAEDQAAPQTPAAYIRELVLRHLRRKR